MEHLNDAIKYSFQKLQNMKLSSKFSLICFPASDHTTFPEATSLVVLYS